MKKILVCDTETHGVTNNPKTGRPDIIELAHVDITGLFEEIDRSSYTFDYLNELSSWFVQRYRPDMPIHPEAFRIHGIAFKDLLGCPKSITAKLPQNVEYFIGHKVSFDWRCLGKPDIKLICTEKLARKLKEHHEIPFTNLKLDTIIEYFYPEKKELYPNTHSAKLDCIKCILLVLKVLEYFPGITSWEQLYKFQEKVKL